MIPMIAAVMLAAAVTTVGAYRGHHRLLIVFAPTTIDRALATQRKGADIATFAERDLRQIEIIGDTVRGATDHAATLRARFGVAPADFRVVLVGKDGHVALDSITPISAARLEATIDAMPMRQDEMRRR